MKCPGCGETNDPGMQFCILCGHSLSAPQAPAPPSAPVSTPEEPQGLTGQRAGGAMVLICSICNKTDPLNGQFCVYCGGRTVAGPAPAAAQTQTFNASAPLSGARSAPPLHLSEELVRSIPVKAASSGSSQASLLLLVLLAVLVGVAVAVAGTYQARVEVEKTALHSFWPNGGVLLFSSLPGADLSIADNKKKSLIFGKTSGNGSLYIPTVSPGSYVLTLSSGGKSQDKEFIVNAGEPSIIGYPDRVSLK